MIEGKGSHVYRHISTHKGWPVLKSAKGMYCYRQAQTDKWLLNSKFTPDEPNCKAAIVAKEGPLPVGDHTWKVADGGKFVERTLTVALVPA